MFIKAPMKPREKPIELTSYRQVFYINFFNFKVPDENKWIHDLHENLKMILTDAIVPLNQYIQKFDKFKDEYCQALEIAENPKEPFEI